MFIHRTHVFVKRFCKENTHSSMPVSLTVSKSFQINVLKFVCNEALARLKCLLVCTVITMVMVFQLAYGMILSGIVSFISC